MSWAEWSAMAGTSGRGGAVTLLGLVKRYDDQAAVDGIDLAIDWGFSPCRPSVVQDEDLGCPGFARPTGGSSARRLDMSDGAGRGP